ncbi:MAG: xanthine dehydrogenase family protein molybdopterin-binding subunit [Deltaproteobacteria bacterium]|nr:xanthine dehydrogenase family protein molybdopterin-binding subunit [Deltaproteobacteria bacterium]
MDSGTASASRRVTSEAVGTSLPRVDGIAKVTGRARYLDDLDAVGAWHGVTVRSTIPHGILDGLDRDPAFDWTDIVVVTAADIPGQNVITLIELDQPALVPVGGTIRHVDEAIALVAAPTRARAFAAARAITARVTPLVPVLSIEDALTGPIQLHGADNVFKRFAIRKGHATDGEIEAALAASAHVIDSVYRTSPQEQMYIEPQAMMAEWREGACHVTGSMQCPYYVHKAMKPLLDLHAEDVIISQTVTGGGFGGKEEYPSMIAAHAALLAKVAQRPVKIVYDRDEDIAATTKRHPALIRHRLGLDALGNPTVIDVDVVMDGGAYATLSAVVLSRGVLHAAGPYKCPVVRIVGRVVATNHPPHGAFRGFGAPQTTFAYERQIEKAARLMGADPLAYRRRHALRAGDTTATSQVLGYSVATDEVLDAIEQCAGTPPVRDGVNASGAPVKRGRGVCFYFHGAGFTGSGEQRLAGRATVALAAGGRFEVRASSTDIGQGAITIFTQLAADGLGVDASRIDVIDPNTARVPDSGPTVASRTCMVVGGLVEAGAKLIAARIRAWAESVGRAGSIEDLADDAFGALGPIAETTQYTPPPGIAWDDATYTGAAYPVFGWAACLVDVAVDLDTYEVAIERCVQAVDVGKAINPAIVKGQIEGGTLQALGWAVLENVVYKNGKVANATMTNCIVPTFADAPELETIIVEVPYPFGPHGAKGVGEIPMDGPAAAVANAVALALGVEFDELPISPEVVAQRLGGQS